MNQFGVFGQLFIWHVAVRVSKIRNDNWNIHQIAVAVSDEHLIESVGIFGDLASPAHQIFQFEVTPILSDDTKASLIDDLAVINITD